MAEQSSVRDLIHRAQDGETLSAEEVAQVTTWVRDDLGPAVQQASTALATGFSEAVKQIGLYFQSPAGQQLIALAQEHERRPA